MQRQHFSTLARFITLAVSIGAFSQSLAKEPLPSGGVSGYLVKKLPLPSDILPSCLAVRPDGTLAVGSMDGDVLLARDSDHDRVPDRYVRWAGTLPHWPLGSVGRRTIGAGA